MWGLVTGGEQASLDLMWLDACEGLLMWLVFCVAGDLAASPATRGITRMMAVFPRVFRNV
jgi:hypothetical protein